MTVDILPVLTKKQLKTFVKLPWKIYAHDPNWVPPLIKMEMERFDPKKNPYYSHSDVALFLAYKGNEPVGRVSAQIDHNFNDFQDAETAHFGFFESIRDKEVAFKLLDAASDWGRARGMKILLGPFSFSTNDVSGLLVEDFNSPPRVMMPYNPPYYKALFEEYGLRKAKDLLAYDIIIDDEFKKFTEHLQRRLKPLAERAESLGFKIRNINLKKVEPEIERVKVIYNDAWERNWGFVPMTDEEFEHLGKELKQVAVPQLAKIVEYKGEPVAFGLVIADINEILIKMNGRLFPTGFLKLLLGFNKIKTVRLITLGIRKGYRKRGADSLLYYHLLKDGLALGRLKVCEVSWLLEDNFLIIRATEFMGGKKVKTYRIYEKAL